MKSVVNNNLDLITEYVARNTNIIGKFIPDYPLALIPSEFRSITGHMGVIIMNIDKCLKGAFQFSLFL